MTKTFKFEELETAPLIIDAIYEGGESGNINDDPLHKILEGVGNQGGFRWAKKLNSDEIAYVVLYTNLEELEWPDEFDPQTGLFKYYGDNRSPGRELHDTRGGNKILCDAFNNLYGTEKDRKKIPPFLIFRKIPHEKSRSVSFLGLASPGLKGSTSGKDLIAVWRTKGLMRFQNYESYFTVLNIPQNLELKVWLKALRNNDPQSEMLAPDAWKRYIKEGSSAIMPLAAERVTKIRNVKEQLPPENDKIGWEILNKVYNYFQSNPFAFEEFSVELLKLMDRNFNSFVVTRPWRDGGRDAIGEYLIGISNDKLKIQCAVEAKCYNPSGGSVGVKEMSRLISRIKHREFGVLVSTSYVSSQAYQEVKDDNHPILIVSGEDVVKILKEHDLADLGLLESWLINNFKLSERIGEVIR